MRRVAGRAGSGAFGVISNVEAGAFELQRGNGDQSMNRTAAASFVDGQIGIGELLHRFE